jgi:uncharacterized protein (TIGR01777 family)
MKIVVAGASGFVGKPLVALLRSAGHEVNTLVRSGAARTASGIFWDPANGVLNANLLSGTDAVVNLAGSNLGERWSRERKKVLRESRLQTTGLLASTIAAMPRKPAVFLCASAIGIYGADRGDADLHEESSEGSDFLALLCHDWEEEARTAAAAGIRVVNSRFGIILNPEGGALEKLLLPFKLGAGGKIGSGEQWMSWIARDDLLAAIRFLLENDSLHGPVNLTAPSPVTNEQLARELGKALHRPSVAPVPAPVIRLMLGREMADLTVLANQRVLPTRLLKAGFEFHFPELAGALRHELSKDAASQR